MQSLIMLSRFSDEALKPNAPKVQELEDFFDFYDAVKKHAAKKKFLK